MNVNVNVEIQLRKTSSYIYEQQISETEKNTIKENTYNLITSQ